MLKFFACLFMLIDHIGFTFFPGALWIRAIGRLAFPIFAWYIAIGFGRTRNQWRYLLRLLIFGLISQLPFALLFHNATFQEPSSFIEGTNVLFTFVFALLAMMLLQESLNKPVHQRILYWIGAVGVAYAAEICKTDYGFYGVLFVLMFYLVKHRGLQVLFAVLLTGVFILLMPMHPIQILSVLAIPFTMIPWSEKKNLTAKDSWPEKKDLPAKDFWPEKKDLTARGTWSEKKDLRAKDFWPYKTKRLVFYAFYPVHILLLWIVTMLS